MDYFIFINGIKGTKFCGIPIGNSPISALVWLPIGLKYLNKIALMLLTAQTSVIISSPICLVNEPFSPTKCSLLISVSEPVRQGV